MMKLILSIAIVALIATLNSVANAGANSSSPETRGWVDYKGQLVTAQEAARLRAADEAKWANMGPAQSVTRESVAERQSLREAYIKKAGWDGVKFNQARGESTWKSIGSYKSNAELRRALGLAGVAAVVGTALGAGEAAEAATVRLKTPDGKTVKPPAVEPGAAATNYRSYSARATAK